MSLTFCKVTPVLELQPAVFNGGFGALLPLRSGDHLAFSIGVADLILNGGFNDLDPGLLALHGLLRRVMLVLHPRSF